MYLLYFIVLFALFQLTSTQAATITSSHTITFTQQHTSTTSSSNDDNDNDKSLFELQQQHIMWTEDDAVSDTSSTHHVYNSHIAEVNIILSVAPLFTQQSYV